MVSTTEKWRGELEKGRGEIVAGASYPQPVFLRKTGIGRKALAAARRNGLIIRRVGRNNFIDADDWFSYLKNRAKVVA